MSKVPSSKYSKLYASNVNDVKKASVPSAQAAKKFKITASNSNAKILSGNSPLFRPTPESIAHMKSQLLRNAGLNSDQLRRNMSERLRSDKGISDPRVLSAMQQVPRHCFMDQGMASRAYEDAALPIGYGQTISMPSVVARMISVLLEQREAGRVLEIGTGCGYQAAVLACVYREVFSIERIQGLHELAKVNLSKVSNLPKIALHYGDGRIGWPEQAPFDSIIIAAAGLEIPQALLTQLKVGGRLIAPEGADQQKLVLIERKATHDWVRRDLEAVRFVPLRAGVQS